jgi:hypothetical protein
LAMTMASSCCARSRSRAIAPSSVAKPHYRGQNSDTWYPAHRSARGGGRVKSHHPYENKQSCCS